MTVLPGVVELLDTIAERYDRKLGLVTGNLDVTAAAKLRAGGLEDYFTFGAYGSDHEDRNLLPAMAMERARDHGHDPVRAERTVVIGDTQHDIGCSRHAGISVVAVATGNISFDVLSQHKPDLLLNDLAVHDDLLRYLDQVAAR